MVLALQLFLKSKSILNLNNICFFLTVLGIQYDIVPGPDPAFQVLADPDLDFIIKVSQI
jgi:hypothetical protein